MLTKLFPMVQFRKDTWEIDEFDCASMFLLIGEERALLMDLGYGIGDLKGAVEMITDKPLTVVISHGHADHIGNARQFKDVWIHPNDKDKVVENGLERIRNSAKLISQRIKGTAVTPYSMFNTYGYDPETDIWVSETGEMPEIHDLYDGWSIDLGGRVITAYECFGHSPGEMVFLDETNRILFAGDAINYNLGWARSGVPLETAVKHLERIRDMGDKYDCIYNNHHDFRALGRPLDDDCLPNIIALGHNILEGKYNPVTVPNFWGPSMPTNTMACRGRNFVGYNPDCIYEEK